MTVDSTEEEYPTGKPIKNSPKIFSHSCEFGIHPDTAEEIMGADMADEVSEAVTGAADGLQITRIAI